LWFSAPVTTSMQEIMSENQPKNLLKMRFFTLPSPMIQSKIKVNVIRHVMKVCGLASNPHHWKWMKNHSSFAWKKGKTYQMLICLRSKIFKLLYFFVLDPILFNMYMKVLNVALTQANSKQTKRMWGFPLRAWQKTI